MIIEVIGTGFQNQGAALMLMAIEQRLRQWDPAVPIAVRPSIGPFRSRARLGLLQIMDVRKAGRSGWLIERLFHRGYRERFGMVMQEEITHVLDGSGYALGDPWQDQPEQIEVKAQFYEQLRASGVNIALMPQALGPFKDARVRAASQRVLETASIVFARDPDSLAAGREVMADSSKLHLAPDFTNLLSGKTPTSPPQGQHPLALIPNEQMLKHNEGLSLEAYVRFFARCADEGKGAGLDPFLLLHESKRDRPLAAMIQQVAKTPLAIYESADARELKGMLGLCSATVGSRFHGLVSALAQGIPSIGTSWSHKYRYLFDDYQTGPLLIEDLADEARIASSLGTLFDPGKRQQLAAQLKQQSQLLKGHSERMWEQMLATLTTR